jgi:UDP-N-acetylglucosamine--dolichyl-phosphate N-acetylglucosaminephosphotransferase
MALIPLWIKKAKKNDIVGSDIHKKDKRKVVEMGGVPVIFGFLLGLLTYVALTINQINTEKNTIFILGILCTILITAIIGILDDVLGWKIGLRQFEKPIVTILATIPIAILGNGTSAFIPIIGNVEFGVFYSLLIIPIIILVTTNGFNMIAGYNGLEAGMGMLILITLGLISFFKLEIFWPGAIAFIMVFALMAFLIFNFYPASIFPGDSLTYSVGALIGIVAIFAHVPYILLILFLLYGIEFFLKLRGKFQKESFSKLKKNGSLYVDGIYGIEHIAVILIGKVKKKVNEKDVVLVIWTFQVILCIIAWSLI